MMTLTKAPDTYTGINQYFAISADWAVDNYKERFQANLYCVSITFASFCMISRRLKQRKTEKIPSLIVLIFSLAGYIY